MIAAYCRTNYAEMGGITIFYIAYGVQIVVFVLLRCYNLITENYKEMILWQTTKRPLKEASA